MKEHGEMNEIFDGSDIRNRGGDGRDAIGKERELLALLRDSDIPVNRIFIVDNL
jgi:hypothetical protein